MRIHSRIIWICLTAVIGSLLAFPASAQITIDNCSSAQPWMISTRMVECIYNQLLIVTGNMMTAISLAMLPITATLFLLAFMFTGARILMGVDDLKKETFSFVLRFAVVVFFIANLPPQGPNFPNSYEFGKAPFAITTSAIKIVSANLTSSPTWAPWEMIDTCIGYIFGFGPGMDLTGYVPARGLIGLIGMSSTAGLIGLLNFIMGFISIISIIYFGLRAVFSYLAALIMIGYMMVISSLFVPLAIFHYTSERITKKAIDLTIAGIINPVVVWAFLAIFLPLIQNIINQFYGMTFGGPPGGVDFSPYWRSGGSMFSWQVPIDPMVWSSFNAQMAGAGQGSTGISATQSFMNPSMSSAMDLGGMSLNGVDLGPQQVQRFQNMILNSLALTIIAYLMLMLLDAVPQIADGIARVSTGLVYQGLPFAQEIKQALSKVRAAMGSA